METLNKNNLRLIFPKNGWLSENIVNNGYTLDYPYHGNSIFFRLFRELHFRLNLPYKNIWYNRRNICNKQILILSATLITADYISWLHEKNPFSRIILIYFNPVNQKYNPNLIHYDYCEKWTSSYSEAKQYHMHLYTGGGYFKEWKVNKESPAFDVFFVGKDKGRLNDLKKLRHIFNRLHISSYFHIVAESKYSLRRKRCYKPFMPYKKVLDNLGKTRAILHLKSGCQDGITIRIMESLIHHIKLITDDKNIVNQDFYHKNNIFILGKDNIHELKQFLASPYVPVKSAFYQCAYFDDMIEFIVKNIYQNCTGDL